MPVIQISQGDHDREVEVAIDTERGGVTPGVKNKIVSRLKFNFPRLVTEKYLSRGNGRRTYYIYVLANGHTTVGLERHVISDVAGELRRHPRVSQVYPTHDEAAHTASITFNFS